MQGRYKVSLKNTSKESVINLPEIIRREIGWSVDDNLQIDIIKIGIDIVMQIKKGE